MNREVVYELPEKQWRFGFTKDMEDYGDLYEKGSVTRQSLLNGSRQEGGVRRPLSDRTERAEDFKKIMKLRSEICPDVVEIDGIINRAKEREKIHRAFLKPNPISVDMGELGIQSTIYMHIKTDTTNINKNPIFIYAGVGNGADGLGILPHRIAQETNQEVFMIAQPDSCEGNITDEFAEAVRTSKKFEPHVNFFKLVTQKILEENGFEKFDLCGVSAGAIIASEIIKDKELSQKIEKKNLIVPPGLTKLSLRDIPKRLKMQLDTIREQKKSGNLSKKMVTNIETVAKERRRIKSQKKSFNAMCLKLIQEYPWWRDLEDTRVIIAKNDAVTFGIKNIAKIKANPKLSMEIIDGGHEIMATEPEKVIEKMVF